MIWPFKRAVQQKIIQPQIIQPRRQMAVYSKRAYEAAKMDRLTANWPAWSQSMDWDLRIGLNALRSRSRYLTQNNEYGKKFLQMCSTHVVGPNGFQLRVRVMDTDAKGKKTLDRAASDAIRDAFLEWGKKGNCDVTGQYSFFDVCNLYIRCVARDGESLVRKVYGKAAGPYGFQLQVLDVERLDVMLNDTLTNGNIVKMGVETTEYGKPVAYHIRTKHPGDNLFTTVQGSTYQRVAAGDMYHHFVADRPEQNRGVPWMHAAMTKIQNLGGYEESAIVAARTGASKMGFFKTPDGNAEPLSTDQQDDGKFMTDAEPGVFDVLPEGYDFVPFDPDYPHAMFDAFVKACLRGIASGLGVSYNTLSNDLEGVNFSSIRTGVLEERDNWMVIQNWMIENFLSDVFTTWLKYALLSGSIALPNGSVLPNAKFDKFNAAVWQGRRWQWVDPLKDVEANVLAINNGLRSRSDSISDQGKDIDDVFAQLSEEQKKISDLGIIIENPDQKVTDQQKVAPTETGQ